jgi:hypothetical protein
MKTFVIYYQEGAIIYAINFKALHWIEAEEIATLTNGEVQGEIIK